MDTDTLDQRIDTWVDAEIAGDTDALDALATDDLVLVGPFGFVLDRPAWLDRYRDGGLLTTGLTFTDRQVRDLGEVAIVIGVHEQKASYAGRPNDGRFRVTQIWTASDGPPMLAGLHVSQITAPPGR